MRHLRIILISCALLVSLSPGVSHAQQPFKTDDADVVEKGKLELQFINEFDVLQRSLFPNLRQNTTDLTLNYGLTKSTEIGIESPLIALFNAPTASPQAVFGIGDASIEIKHNFRKEHNRSWIPALTMSFNVEFPTGDTDRQLGSGLTDYTITGIFQKSVSAKATLRINTGLIVAGDATTGLIGARNEGIAFVGGSSIVRQFTDWLDLGFEVTGVATADPEIDNQLQVQIGGQYDLWENFSIDFGVITGRDIASPRLGVQLGFTFQF